MLKLLSKPWLENDSAALDESIKSLLQFTDDELSELSYGVQNIFAFKLFGTRDQSKILVPRYSRKLDGHASNWAGMIFFCPRKILFSPH